MGDDYRPQDEYFEWDDIMVYKGPTRDDDGFKDYTSSGYGAPINRAFTFDSSDRTGEDFSWSDASSLSTTPSSLSSTESLSLCSLKEEKTNVEIDFPSYDDATTYRSCVTIDIDSTLELTRPPSPILDPVSDEVAFPDSEVLSTMPSRGDIHVGARDDSALNLQPFRNVNYLTHDWCEEDIPSTWRHVVSKRADWSDTTTGKKSAFKPINMTPRYENALWRTWAQRRFQLGTVSPEVINWMKSCDETTLYGPFMMAADEFAPTSVIADCSRDSKLRSKGERKPLLRRPAMSEILLRGSIPTFLSTRCFNGETYQTAFQAKPSYDPSVACPGMSVSQRRELTSVARSKLGLHHTKKSVRFLNEVEQYEIIKLRVSSKHRRTLKKVAPTTLDKSAYHLPPPIKTSHVKNHWSPASLWTFNSEGSLEKENSEDPWMDVISAYSNATTSPIPTPTHKQQFPAAPDPPPRSKNNAPHSRTPSISITNDSLTTHLQNLKYEDEADDELDYLIAIASPPSESSSPPSLTGSSSPPTPEISISNSRTGSSSSFESSSCFSDEDEIPFFGTGDIADERRSEKAAPIGMGIDLGVRILGERGSMEEEERSLFLDMEEYELVLG